MPVQPVSTRAATIAAAWIRGFNNIHMSSNLYHDRQSLRCPDRQSGLLSIKILALLSKLGMLPPGDEIGDRAGKSAAITMANPCDRHRIRTDISVGVLPQRPFRPARRTNRP